MTMNEAPTADGGPGFLAFLAFFLLAARPVVPHAQHERADAADVLPPAGGPPRQGRPAGGAGRGSAPSRIGPVDPAAGRRHAPRWTASGPVDERRRGARCRGGDGTTGTDEQGPCVGQ